MNNLFLRLYVKVQGLKTGDGGQDLVEYALLLTMISLALITSMKSIASAVSTVFSNISGSLA